MLDELKSKLGFGGGAVRGRSSDRYDDYDDDYGDYEDDYSEYAEYADDSENDYDPYAPVTTRSARSNSTISNLVSINDVRAHSRGEGSSSTPTSSARRMTTAQTPDRGERTTVDSSLPPQSSAAAAMSETARKASAQASSAYDPPSAYAQAQGARYVAKRSCTVLKPASYGEVEKIARALKGGDAVILALRNTPDSLSKRILDFSFGVSSALDAGVECVGDKVFAITKGDALTDAEKLALRNQGVL